MLSEVLVVLFKVLLLLRLLFRHVALMSSFPILIRFVLAFLPFLGFPLETMPKTLRFGIDVLLKVWRSTVVPCGVDTIAA